MTTASKSHVTRGKLLLIGVLAVVLVTVVYWNYFRDGSRSSAAAKTAAKKPARSAKSAATASARPNRGRTNAGRDSPRHPAAARPPTTWPSIELAEVIAYDPFALPDAFPKPPPSVAGLVRENTTTPRPSEQTDLAAQERAVVISAIRQQGVQLVLRNGQEYVAKIGDRQVRVGDTIGGLRVVDISLRGVVLEGEASP